MNCSSSISPPLCFHKIHHFYPTYIFTRAKKKHFFASNLDEYTVDIFPSVNSFLGEFGFVVMNMKPPSACAQYKTQWILCMVLILLKFLQRLKMTNSHQVLHFWTAAGTVPLQSQGGLKMRMLMFISASCCPNRTEAADVWSWMTEGSWDETIGSKLGSHNARKSCFCRCFNLLGEPDSWLLCWSDR